MSSVYQLLFFLINPVLGLISSIYYMFKINTTINIFSMALSIALIFIYMPLMFDMSTHFYIYYYSLANTYAEIDFYDFIIKNLHIFFGFEFMFMMLLSTFFIIFVWLYIYNTNILKITSKQELILMSLFVLSFFIYRNIMDLQRFYLAVFFFLLYIFYIDHEKIKVEKYKIFRLLLISIITFYIHPASLVFTVLYLISQLSISKYVLYILPIITLIIGNYSFELMNFILNLSFVNIINPKYISSIQFYIDPNTEWGGGKLVLLLLMLRFIEFPLMLLLYYKGLKLLDIQKDDITIKFTMLLMSVVFMTFLYTTLYERYSGAFFIFSLFIVYKSITHLKKDIVIYLIIGLYIIRNIFINYFIYGWIFTSVYNNILPNEGKKIEMLSKPFYYPTVLLLWIDNNGYSDKYIRKESTRGRDVYLHSNFL